MTDLVEGSKAPDFQLTDDSGNVVTLADFAGRTVVLYFYPRDDTPGCTKQACGFRDHWKAFETAGVVVLGVSPDTVESHGKFKEKYGLPFPLLSDPDHKVASEYGAWGTKKLYGREFEGIKRSTFVIGEDGSLRKVFRNVRNPGDHWEAVLKAIS
jgi:thioredoxin-dependent peroxiredoxin